ncbi:hypothetical protein [Actinophytocola sp.]|jgi:hypothetical protein|uniref:hypothetical protein n=1 Tax=Actinophytocola sp. TaxID=1872138 RepID=UPI002EDB46EF
MSPQGFHAVPRRYAPSILTVDGHLPGRRTPRFLTLVIRAYREWEQGRTEEPVRYPVDYPPAT